MKLTPNVLPTWTAHMPTPPFVASPTVSDPKEWEDWLSMIFSIPLLRDPYSEAGAEWEGEANTLSLTICII